MTDEASPIEATPGAVTPARQALAALRPQVYGSGGPKSIRDPLIEPLWTGIRALAAVDGEGVALVDADAFPIPGMAAIVAALPDAVQADGVVLDGVLTRQTTHQGLGIVWPDEMPSMRQLIGLRSNRALDAVTLKEDALTDKTFDPDEEVSFVVTDLLWLDDAELVDIPFLERRRLLDATLVESDVIRLGAFVRPPIDSWVSSWRTQGFHGITYKAANSRYLSGRPNPDWVIGGMPRR
jgi:hypothetical protein